MVVVVFYYPPLAKPQKSLMVDAINDKNVLPFRVDYIKTMDIEPDIDDEQVWDINRKKAFEAPERISLSHL